MHTGPLDHRVAHLAKILVGVGAHALYLPNMKHVLPKAVHGGPLAELDEQHRSINLSKGRALEPLPDRCALAGFVWVLAGFRWT